MIHIAESSGHPSAGRPADLIAVHHVHESNHRRLSEHAGICQGCVSVRMTYRLMLA
jgi:hypothetical protein